MHAAAKPRTRCLALISVFLLCLTLQAQEEPRIPWEQGPVRGQLMNQAVINLPDHYLFTGSAGTKTFLELTQNFPNGQEAGMFVPRTPEGQEQKSWFVIFEYHNVGYVKDKDKDDLDADALLKSIREGTEAANQERTKRGWPTLHVVSWSKPPFYDAKTNNLTWGTLLRDSKGEETVNYTTRMLGRHGYMQVDLVTPPAEFESAVRDYEQAMQGFAFTDGNRYAEFKAGDKIANIGLATLVAGGAGAALVKSGLLTKLWKLIVPAIAALGMFVRRIWGKLTGRSNPEA